MNKNMGRSACLGWRGLAVGLRAMSAVTWGSSGCGVMRCVPELRRRQGWCKEGLDFEPSAFSRTWARSYKVCKFIQLSGVRPKAFASLWAISGEMPFLPLINSNSVLRLTPNPCAAAVIVKPSGSR